MLYYKQDIFLRHIQDTRELCPSRLAVITENFLDFSVTPESCLDSTIKYVIILSPIYTSN
jgi:hypothetical protein